MKKQSMSPREVVKLAIEAQNIMSSLEDVKKLYGRLDEITMLLKGEDLSGVSLVVIDNFAEKNVVFRPAGVRRFELKKAA
jgi:hypothetical protein